MKLLEYYNQDKKWDKEFMKELGLEISLAPNQIYKWYYDQKKKS